MGVARNICLDPRLVPGGGSCEMAVSRGLSDRAAGVEGVEQWPYKAVGECWFCGVVCPFSLLQTLVCTSPQAP